MLKFFVFFIRFDLIKQINISNEISNRSKSIFFLSNVLEFSLFKIRVLRFFIPLEIFRLRRTQKKNNLNFIPSLSLLPLSLLSFYKTGNESTKFSQLISWKNSKLNNGQLIFPYSPFLYSSNFSYKNILKMN
mgnify:CR=1 FL=1